MVVAIHALFLAALLCLPLALLGWRRYVTHGRREGHELVAGALQPAALIGTVKTFRIAVIAITAWLMLASIGIAMDLPHRLIVMGLVATGMGCMLVAPSYPLAGPIVYILLSYTFPREGAVTVGMMDIGTMSWVTALSIAAVLIWRRSRPTPGAAPDSLLAWTMALFSAWIAVATVAAVFNGQPVGPDLLARVTRYVHAVAFFFVVAFCRPGLGDLRFITFLLSSALIVRQLWLTPNFLFEQNLAMLAVIAVPMAVAMVLSRPIGPLQIALGPVALYVGYMVVFVQNRGAQVGLATAAVVMIVTAPARWLFLAASLATGVPAVAWALHKGFFNRFWQVYSQGAFTGTAASRLEIWRGGLNLARDHWLFGVGPGNFSVFLGISAHNSLIDALTETGAVGLALYVAVFAIAMWRLWRLGRRRPGDWRSSASWGVMGALSAHLAAGSFLNNTNLVWTYVLLGVAASIAAPSARPDVPLTDAQ